MFSAVCDLVRANREMAALEKKYRILAEKHREDYARMYRNVNGIVREETAYLPTDPKERKAIPLCTGVLDYFPLALAEVAKVSKAGNDQHNPGQEMHWARGKSMDFADTILRHLVERGSVDTDGQRHSAKLAWRALAMLQIELEQALNKPMSRASTK